jgi:hypothetical protein
MEVVLHPVDGETVPEVETVAHIEPTKKRGRPPGAKNKKPKQEPVEDEPVEDEPKEDEPVTEEPEESSDEPPKPTLPPKRKKRVVESESEEEVPRIVRRKKPIQPKPVQPQDSPRTRTFKLRQDYHNQRVNGYTHMLNEMLSY